MISAGSIRVVHPLFQEEGDGSQPISALQLRVGRISPEKAMHFNRDWHSRLPELTNWRHCFAYGATFLNCYYAVALWSHPVARMLNGRGMLELRRMAVSPEAPKNTASRVLRIMALLIRRELPETRTLISYQDTGVHLGTIYKAAGWKPVPQRAGDGKGWGKGWQSRKRNQEQTRSDKVRWELTLYNG